ncbi:MAG: hypothetical protein GY805_38875 [Chloroflexi bacterium]|nr:hypothetical protein [Chloroflexota bacterium]
MVKEIQSFVNGLRRRNPQARTWKDYRHVLNGFHAAVGDKSPDAVTIKDVDDFVGKLVEHSLQAAANNRAAREERQRAQRQHRRRPLADAGNSFANGVAAGKPASVGDGVAVWLENPGGDG